MLRGVSLLGRCLEMLEKGFYLIPESCLLQYVQLICVGG
jgi:hypothetical protein